VRSCKHSGGCSCLPWSLFITVWTAVELPTVSDWAGTNFPNLALRTLDYNYSDLAVVFEYEKSPHAGRGHIPQGSLGTCFLLFMTHVCTHNVLFSSEGMVARYTISTRVDAHCVMWHTRTSWYCCLCSHYCTSLKPNSTGIWHSIL